MECLVFNHGNSEDEKEYATRISQFCGENKGMLSLDKGELANIILRRCKEWRVKWKQSWYIHKRSIEVESFQDNM